MNLRLLQLSSEIHLLLLGLSRKAQRGRVDIGKFGITQVAGIQIKAAAQVGQGALRLHCHIDKTGRRSRYAEVIEQFFQIKILRLKCCRYFPIRRKDRLARTNIFPDKWNGDVTCDVLRFLLIELNFGNLEPFASGRNDCLEIHSIAAEKNDRNLEPGRCISGVDIRLQFFHVAEFAAAPGEF